MQQIEKRIKDEQIFLLDVTTVKHRMRLASKKKKVKIKWMQPEENRRYWLVRYKSLGVFSLCMCVCVSFHFGVDAICSFRVYARYDERRARKPTALRNETSLDVIDPFFEKSYARQQHSSSRKYYPPDAIVHLPFSLSLSLSLSLSS